MTITEQETYQRWPLPEGWRWQQLGRLVDIHDHKRKPIKSSERDKRILGKAATDLFPYFGATGQVGYIDGYLFDFPAVLLGEDGAPFLDRNRKKAYIASGRYWVNNHAHILTPRPGIALRWLLHALNFTDYEPHVGGTTRLKLTKAELQKIPIPVPPFQQQERIVARIDALFAEIDEGEAALAQARQGLETFRRALLKSAVTGELTADWRRAHPNDKTGVRSWDELTTIISANKRGQRNAPAHNPREGVTGDLPQIPDGWRWISLQELISAGPSNGYSPKRSSDGSGTPALKLTATTKGQLDLSEKAIKQLSEVIPQDSPLFLRTGDLLFQRGNTIEYVGIAAIYEGPERKYIYPDLMIRVRTESSVLTEWIWRVANSPFGRKFMADHATGTAGTMPKISGETVRSLPVPLPPPNELSEILRRISTSFAEQDETATLLDAEIKDLSRLKGSVLKAAFEGRLASQDAADAPASAVLSQLQSEAASQPTPRKRRAGATS